MLKKRIITAAILIPIVLAVLFYFPPLAFCVLTGVITLIGGWEWTGLMKVKKQFNRWLYLLLMALISAATLFMPFFYILLIAFAWWAVAFFLVAVYPRASTKWSKGSFIPGLIGMLVLVPCWGSINFIRNQLDGIYVLLYLLLLVWGVDSIAFFAGKKWGKHKLAAKVSPGKTWQGAGAASLFALVFALIAGLIGGVPANTLVLGVLLSLVTAWISIVGDLTESMFKRQAGVKDSGHIFPGHGGLLDRIDSLTAAAPIFALGSLLISVYF